MGLFNICYLYNKHVKAVNLMLLIGVSTSYITCTDNYYCFTNITFFSLNWNLSRLM